MRNLLPALVMSLVVSLAACSSPEPGDGSSQGTLLIGEATSSVEVADTDTERQQGLQGRDALAEDAGMAFLWREPHEGGFWMEDTLIPLSIAFWGSDGRVVAILDMEPCEIDECPRYDPGLPYVGAVEVNQGWFASNGIQVGDSVTLET